jgi:hypothetical protein
MFTITLGISSALLVLSALLLQALKLLALLDTQLQRCSTDENGELLEEIAFTIEDDEETPEPISNEVNGFTLAVVPDTKNIVGSLKRRYAIATDSLGVIVLKGEPSFSANDEVLIAELAFYIRSNDLKAN